MDARLGELCQLSESDNFPLTHPSRQLVSGPPAGTSSATLQDGKYLYRSGLAAWRCWVIESNGTSAPQSVHPALPLGSSTSTWDWEAFKEQGDRLRLVIRRPWRNFALKTER